MCMLNKLHGSPPLNALLEDGGLIASLLCIMNCDGYCTALECKATPALINRSVASVHAAATVPVQLYSQCKTATHVLSKRATYELTGSITFLCPSLFVKTTLNVRLHQTNCFLPLINYP